MAHGDGNDVGGIDVDIDDELDVDDDLFGDQENERSGRTGTPLRGVVREVVVDFLVRRGWLRNAEDPRQRLIAPGAVIIFVLGALVSGYALFRPDEAPATELLLPFAEPSVTPGAGVPIGGETDGTVQIPRATLTVHGAGAVLYPGLYALPEGARVADLLAAAGGPRPDTDLDRVNLAAVLGDGQRVWFPAIGEAAAPAVIDGGGGGAPAGGAGAPGEANGPININTATAAELEALPGVGPAIAAAIVEYRERNGPFSSVDDLLDVPGIGDAKLAAMAAQVTV